MHHMDDLTQLPDRHGDLQLNLECLIHSTKFALNVGLGTVNIGSKVFYQVIAGYWIEWQANRYYAGGVGLGIK